VPSRRRRQNTERGGAPARKPASGSCYPTPIVCSCRQPHARRLPRSMATPAHVHRLLTPPCQDPLSPEATVTGAAVVGVSAEWRCRRMTMGLNWSAGSDSEEAGGAGTRALAVGEGKGRSGHRYKLLHSYQMEAESWIFLDPM
jgi:hypothetical protein